MIDGSHPMRIGPGTDHRTVSVAASEVVRQAVSLRVGVSYCIVLSCHMVSTIGLSLAHYEFLVARDVAQLTTGRSHRRPSSSSTARATLTVAAGLAAWLAGAPPVQLHRPSATRSGGVAGPVCAGRTGARAFLDEAGAPRFVASSLGVSRVVLTVLHGSRRPSTCGSGVQPAAPRTAGNRGVAHGGDFARWALVSLVGSSTPPRRSELRLCASPSRSAPPPPLPR